MSEGVTERVSERQNEPNFVPSAVFISCLKKIYSTRLDDFNFLQIKIFMLQSQKRIFVPTSVGSTARRSSFLDGH